MPANTNSHKLFLLFAVYFFSLKVAAQQSIANLSDSAALFSKTVSRICSHDKMLYELRKDPFYVQREAKMNQEIRNAISKINADTIITLPVVVHIINPNPYAITDLQVIDGINLLNDAFSKSGIYAASPGADTKLRFCLAKKSPEGGITTGITRTTSFFSTHLNKDIEDGKLKNLVQWDPLKYINIWLITSIDAEAYSDFTCGLWYRLGVGGYATLPPGGGPTDGIVVTGFGALLAHEMGHYLGLYHTFQGGCANYDCSLDGDMVCDTPPDGTVRPSAGCNLPSNTCNTDTLSNYSNGNFFTDVPDQIKNFMDYGNAGCSIQFTQGQADRMRGAIISQRSGLLENECDPPCQENIVTAFTRDIAYPVIGDLVTFTNTSSGASNFEWLVNGVVISSTTNFTYTFNAAGKDTVTLKAFNTPGCFGAYTNFIITNCGVTARFYTNKQVIASKVGILLDSIVFTNDSYNGLAYEWLMSNDQGMQEQVVGTNANITYVFPAPANYYMRLVATNGSCQDTTDSYTISVLDPTPDGYVYGSAYCFQQTKIKLTLCIADFGYAPLPAHTPVTFYDGDPHLPTAHKLSPTFYLPAASPGGNCATCYTHIVDVQYPFLDKLYMVFADSGNAVPVVLPNLPLIEKNYANNFNSINNIRFRATATPVTATLLPGDTLQLSATGAPAAPTGLNTYLWSTAYLLSCTTCRSPYLYADSDRVKRVIVTSSYGCYDTAYVDIKVPPANDYSIHMDNAICASHDSMSINFTVYNSFIRGSIPRDLKISFYQGDPTTAGAVLLPPVYSVADTVFLRQQSFSARIKIMTEGNLYAVVNDSTMQIPITLPNTPKLEKDYSNNMHSLYYEPNKTIIDTAICQGQTYSGYNIAGTYIDTLSGYNGCDSIITLHLIIKPVFNTTITASICDGENYAGHTTSGVYVDVYPAFNGCDSTRTLHLTVKPVFHTTVTTAICDGENYAGHTTTGMYVDIYTAANGCDSTRTLYLTVKPVFHTTVITSICDGQQYAGHTISGTYVDIYTAANGCDSTRTLYLTVNPVFTTFVTASICDGENYAGHTTTGIYIDVYTAANGCDSTRTLNLLVNPVKFTTVTTSICLGQDYAGHTISGTYVDVYSTTLGCDSTRTLHLTVNLPVSTTINKVICQDDSYAGYNSTGTYTDIFTAANGCDSTRTLYLLVNPKKFTAVNAAICKGETYLAGGHLQTITGVYTDSLLTYLGCDSLVSTHLTVNPLPTPDLGKDKSICSGDVLTLNPGTFVSYQWQNGSTNNIYTTNVVGQYMVLVTNNFGCKASDTMRVLKIFPLPKKFLPADTSLCRGNPVKITVPGYINYLWTTGDTQNYLQIIKSGLYGLQVTDRNGCIGIDTMKVYYYNCGIVWIPNAFTPDNNGANDVFKPNFPAPVQNYRMQIWNRWGLRVFETTSSSIGWDGKFKSDTQPSAVYIYIITFRDIDGIDVKKTGTITLIR
jgi:gliding motility-associated-like protein